MASFFNTTSLCNIFMKNTFKRTIHRKQNHYEVLKLTQNCNHKDIKQAYYELSKKYHPDRNHNSCPKLFLEVSEAYKTLSKPELRSRYDISLLPSQHRYRSDHYDQFTRRNRMDEPAFYRRRGSSYEYDYQPSSYNVRRGDRVSNSVILAVVLLCMALGVTLQVLTFRHAMRIRKEELKLSSALANRSIERARLLGDDGNKAQIKLLEEHFRANNISLE